MEEEKPKKKRGFGGMDPEKVRQIASMGGKKAHEVGTAHKFNTESAREAGRKGGLAPHKTRGTQKQTELPLEPEVES